MRIPLVLASLIAIPILAGCQWQGSKVSTELSPSAKENRFSISVADSIVVCSTQSVRECPDMAEKIIRTENEWKKLLDPDQYRVTRQKVSWFSLKWTIGLQELVGAGRSVRQPEWVF